MLQFSVFAKQYYVSNAGNDSNDGLTPQTAWKTIAKVNSKMNTFVTGDVISFNGGDEFYGTLIISNKSNLTVTSYGTGQAIIKGSEAITNWVDTGGNVWTANVTGKTIFNVFKDGNNTNNTRMPLPDMYTIDPGSTSTNIISADVIGLPDIVGATVYTEKNQWTMEDNLVTGFNSGTGKITLYPGKGVTIGVGFTIHNHKNLLASQDDWAYESTTNTLYMYSTNSPTGITATTLNNNGIYLTLSNYIKINNINIRDFATNGISMKKSTNIDIDANLIENCMDTGVTDWVSPYGNSPDITVTNNTILNSGLYGVRIDGKRAVIDDNIITSVGMLETKTWVNSGYSLGIRAGGTNNTNASDGDNGLIRRNLISDIAYSAISYIGANTEISDNYINNYGVYLPDGGGIYTYNPVWNDGRALNSKILRNTIINSEFPRFRVTIGAIYIDDRTTSILIDRNNIQGGKRGVFLHNSRNMTVTNNNIYKTFESGIYVSEDQRVKAGEVYGNIVTDNNIMLDQNDPYFSNNSVGGAISTFSTYTSLNLASYDRNKLYNPYSYKQIRVLNDNDFWFNNSFSKPINLLEWQTLSGNDLNSNEYPEYWGDGYMGYKGFPVKVNTYMEVNQFSNGDFVGGDITGWASLSGQATGVDNGAGDYFWQLNPTASSGSGIRAQKAEYLSVSEGDMYLIEFSAKCASKNTAQLKLEELTNYYGARFPIFLDNEWRTYRIPMKFGFSATNLRLQLTMNESSDVLQIDNLSFRKVTLSADKLPERTFFAYNETSTTKGIILPAGAWKDLDGKTYSGSISVQSHSSKILILSNGSVSANAGADVSICTGDSTTLTASGGSTYSWSNGETTASITVSPTTTTTYTVTVGDGAGNTSTDSVIVTVNSVTANAGADVSIIDGDSTTLTASGGDTYLWSTGETTASITVNPNVTTTYTATVTQNGCSDTDTVQVTVTSPPPSTVVANAGADVTICNGDSTTLTASGGSTYLWSTGETTANITVNPTTTTTYSVTVGDGAGNSDTDNVIVTVNTVTANAGADVTIINGDSITLTASGGDTYLWSSGETTASITVNPSSTTSYTVTATIGSCTDSAVVQVTVDPVTGTVNANAGADVSICSGESTVLTASGGSLYQWSTGETTQSITVSPGTTQTFSVTVSEEGSNSASDDVIVTVNDVPVANAGSNVTIETGQNVTLTASGGDTYLWSTGETTASIKVSPETTTVYSVTVFKNTCQDTASVQVTVNQVDITNPPPAKANAGQDVTICIGESANLIASGGATYLWSTGEAQKSINVKPTRTTTYSLEATRGGITDTDTVTVTVQNCTGTFNDTSSSMAIYPNPTKGNLNVSINNNLNENFNIFITDAKGSVIYMDKLDVKQDSYSKEIDLSQYAKGIYFVRLFNSDQNLVKKIVII